MQDLDGWVGGRTRGGITGGLNDPGEIDNGKVIDFSVEKGLCVGNTYLEHKSLHKYTRMDRDQDGVEVMSTIEFVLVKKDMLCYVKLGWWMHGLKGKRW